MELMFTLFDCIESKPLSCLAMLVSAGWILWRPFGRSMLAGAAKWIAFAGVWAFCLFGPVFPNLVQFARIAQLNREGADEPHSGFVHLKTLDVPELVELLDTSYGKFIRFAAAVELIARDADLRPYTKEFVGLPLFAEPGYWDGWPLREFSRTVKFPASFGEIREQFKKSPLKDKLMQGTR
jgi:hypothetical protein